MKNKSLFELGKLAQQGNDMAMLEIIERKKKMIKKYIIRQWDFRSILRYKNISL